MMHLRVNLFVNPIHAKIIEINLQDIEREIEKLEVEVNRIKHYYENINSPSIFDPTK
jgi:archaellum component FlaC